MPDFTFLLLHVAHHADSARFYSALFGLWARDPNEHRLRVFAPVAG